MRKLIDGKLYDTENSTEIARWSNRSTKDDLRLEETLYRTAEADYFICGKGGSLTPYAKHDGEHLTGCDIRPLTRHEAAVWAAVHDYKDLLATEFPDEKKNVTKI